MRQLFGLIKGTFSIILVLLGTVVVIALFTRMFADSGNPDVSRIMVDAQVGRSPALSREEAQELYAQLQARADFPFGQSPVTDPVPDSHASTKKPAFKPSGIFNFDGNGALKLFPDTGNAQKNGRCNLSEIALDGGHTFSKVDRNA